MEGTNNRICEVDFEILLRVQKNRGRNHEAEARERERASGSSQTSGEDTAWVRVGKCKVMACRTL